MTPFISQPFVGGFTYRLCIIRKHVQKQRNKEEEHVGVDNSLNERKPGIADADHDLILFQTRVVHVKSCRFRTNFPRRLYINCYRAGGVQLVLTTWKINSSNRRKMIVWKIIFFLFQGVYSLNPAGIAEFEASKGHLSWDRVGRLESSAIGRY